MGKGLNAKKEAALRRPRARKKGGRLFYKAVTAALVKEAFTLPFASRNSAAT